MTEPAIWAWRHPRAEGAEGRCIGRTDLPVDRRRAKHLARRIQAAARQHRLPQVVHTSPLARCADVGRWLRRWGWRHVIDPALLELDFGRWEGRRWSEIERSQIDAWCQDFAGTAPGGGECVAAMLERAGRWCGLPSSGEPIVMVAHAGWILARRWWIERPYDLPQADEWPTAMAHGSLVLMARAAVGAQTHQRIPGRPQHRLKRASRSA